METDPRLANLLQDLTVAGTAAGQVQTKTKTQRWCLQCTGDPTWTLKSPPRLQKPLRPLAAPFPMEAWGRRCCHCCDFTHRSQLSATVCDDRGLNVPPSLAELGVAMRPRTFLRAFLKGSQPCAPELGPQHSTQSSLNSTGSHGRQRILDGPTVNAVPSQVAPAGAFNPLREGGGARRCPDQMATSRLHGNQTDWGLAVAAHQWGAHLTTPLSLSFSIHAVSCFQA
ncbi:uncharacterized protein LOC116274443 [Papio anubis]|uniref:uncharacterized protein LOC116274443 n=1 Tax=Papio anubis TaxID=9555 RepID=UPI0012AE5FCB|nr:uncharacterized protein LOC116274443 [Papio anubis]